MLIVPGMCISLCLSIHASVFGREGAGVLLRWYAIMYVPSYVPRYVSGAIVSCVVKSPLPALGMLDVLMVSVFCFAWFCATWLAFSIAACDCSGVVEWRCK